MILSDRTIREELAAGRIVIEPLDEKCIQPSSVDLHVDRFFRVFRNHTMGHIDVKEDQAELTELIEVAEDDVFILHPGEFVLGSTAERVKLPDDLVARLEGKSSLGRLGLLIHSSLPGDEPVLVLHDGQLVERTIQDVVRKQLAASVISFDPETFDVEYHPITGWYEGPPDRIFEIRLASGRSARVTAGHNLFTLDREGTIQAVRTGMLAPGMRVAIPRSIPDPPVPSPTLDLRTLVPDSASSWLVAEGPTVRRALEDPVVARTLRSAGYRHVDYYRRRDALPLSVVAQLPGVMGALGASDRFRARGGANGLPVVLSVDEELAWLFGIYVAEGSRRHGQTVVSNTDDRILDRAEQVFASMGLPVSRRSGVSITCCSRLVSEVFGWLGTGEGAPHKRLPSGALGWPGPLLEALLEGLLDGDGSHRDDRRCYWSCSPGLAHDMLLLCQRLGLRASSSHRERGVHGLFQVSIPPEEHKLLTSVPLADRLLIAARKSAGLSQVGAALAAGFRGPSDLNNIERRSGRDAVRLRTLRRLRDVYVGAGPGIAADRLDRMIDGDLAWDTVVEVRDTGRIESTFDIEVRPGRQPIANFVAGTGGVFVSNTAGFVDAGWDGHLTLELSNVANLPITIYPGMKIGQISFLRMTTPADAPYGSATIGSKYQGQRGPTPSRYSENFRSDLA